MATIEQKWLEIARKDYEVAQLTYNNGYWLYSVYLCHQAIEKTLKAYYCATHDNDPRYTHSHRRLIDDCGLTNQLSEEQHRFIDLMAPMYIKARYPEQKEEISRILDKETCLYILNSTKGFAQWIEQQLLLATRR